MPLTRSDIATSLLPGVKAIFGEAYDKEQAPLADRLATSIPSESDLENYGWLGSTPKMREFIKERQLKGLTGFEFTIKNRLWESSLEIERTAIEDHKTGHIPLRIAGLAREARRHPDELVINLLMNGYAALTQPVTTCYDGQNLISASHTAPPGGSAQSNYGSTTQLAGAAVAVARAAMMNLLDDQGKPFGVVPDTLLVSPTNEVKAREICESLYDPAGSTMKKNVLAGRLEVAVSPYLASYPYYWYLIDSSSVPRPVILQMRTAPEIEALEANSESGFMRDMYCYGVRARYNAGAGFWPAVYMTAATT